MLSNNVYINTSSKSKALIFSSQECFLDLSYSGDVKVLGVMVDGKLNSKSHINNVVARYNLALLQLYGSDLVLPQNVKHKLVHALIITSYSLLY